MVSGQGISSGDRCGFPRVIVYRNLPLQYVDDRAFDVFCSDGSKFISVNQQPQCGDGIQVRIPRAQQSGQLPLEGRPIKIAELRAVPDTVDIQPQANNMVIRDKRKHPGQCQLFAGYVPERGAPESAVNTAEYGLLRVVASTELGLGRQPATRHNMNRVIEVKNIPLKLREIGDELDLRLA